MSILWAAAGECMPGGACPVCDRAGSHAVRLRIADNRGNPHTLLACDGCGTHFYADRTPKAYETTDSYDDVAAAFYMEQNGGLLHMVRLLFVVETPERPSVLDVGCGFGVSVIAADRVLGWRACGLDPGPLAAQARALTGCDIRSAYLDADSELGEPFALVTGSEVIEHVPEPREFLDLARRWVRPDGALVLTTPNAAWITPDQPVAIVAPILSPGQHLVLFNAASLRLCLHRAGFVHVRVEEHGANLLAVASACPLRLLHDPAAEQRAYAGLLRQLMALAPRGTAIWNGAAGRLYRSLVAGGQDTEAAILFDDIAHVWRGRFGFDITAPATVEVPCAEGIDQRLLMQAMPANLGAVLLARAAIEQRRRHPDTLALLGWLRAAGNTAMAMRRALLGIGLEDLDLREVSLDARILLAEATAAIVPELEGVLLGSLFAAGLAAELGMRDIPPERLVARLAPRFVALVHQGNYAQAAGLAAPLADLDAVCRHLAGSALLHTLYCLGVQHLNGTRDKAAARMPLRRLADEARRLDSPEAAEFLALAARHLALAGVA